MAEHLFAEGAYLTVPDNARSTRTTNDRGETRRFIVDPVLVIAASTVDPAGESALDVAAAIRANYVSTTLYRREASPQPDPVDGEERAILRFRWSSDTGEEQASRLLVVCRDGRAVAVNATLPAARVDELESQVSGILRSVRMV